MLYIARKDSIYVGVEEEYIENHSFAPLSPLPGVTLASKVGWQLQGTRAQGRG